MIVDFLSHGMKDKLAFRKPLTMDALADGIRPHLKELTFTVNGLDCFGGGREKAWTTLMKDPAMRNGVGMFTQTKGHAVNLPALTMSAKDAKARQKQREERAEDTELDSTASPYYLHMIRGLYDRKKTYGQIVREADKGAKYYGTDASSIIDGVIISRSHAPDAGRGAAA